MQFEKGPGRKAGKRSGTFGWCFIGAGKLAGIVAEEILATGRHEIVSVYTRSIEKGRLFAEKAGAAAYENALDAMTAEGVDGVYVVTTHNAHFEYADLALRHGLPVLCEKAMTVRAEETERLFALAKEKQVYLAEAMWTWFAPVAHQVKAWLDEGLLGDVLSAHFDMCLPAAEYAPRVTDPNAAGGALLDLAVYPVTYAYRLFGMPDSIECTGTVRDGIDTDERITMHYPDGKSCTIATDLYGIRGKGGFYEITGTKGSIRLPGFHHADEVTLRLENGEERTFRGDGSYAHEFDTVADEIRAGRTESAYVRPADTIAVMRLLDDCRKQLGLVYPFER